MIELEIVDTKRAAVQFVESPAAVKPDKVFSTSTSRWVRTFTINDMLDQLSNLQEYTAVLGLGEDGLPLLFDLRDPQPGSILILGDKFSGKTSLLKAITLSIISRNQPNDVQFAVLSGRPEQWKFIKQSNPKFFCHLHSNYERSAATTILEMCDLVAVRQKSKLIDRAILFFLDGMDTVPYMDFGIRMNFEWLLKEGPGVRVWPIATIDTQSALQQPRWLNRFRTKLVGSIDDVIHGFNPGFSNVINPSDLVPGSQFAVRLNQTWLKFSIPEINA